MDTHQNSNILEIKNLTKSFPGVIALENISFSVKKGDTHVILGENGAGKSTLIKSITGAYSVDEGEIFFCGKPLRVKTVKESMALGIGCVYQELKLFPELSIKENIFIGDEVKKARIFIDWKEIESKTKGVLRTIGLDIDPNTKIRNLGIGQQQLVEIAKCLVKNVKLIIMDEPTSSLSSKEINILYDVIGKLKKENVTIIFISHKMDEVMKVGDIISVLKDGKLTGTIEKTKTTPGELIEMMVGRSFSTMFPKNNANSSDIALKVNGFSSGKLFNDINLEVRKGEMVGLYGVVGAGRTELVRAIFGVDTKTEGQLEILGEKVNVTSPIKAIQHGVAFLTEDRKGEGLFLDHSVEFNINIAQLSLFFRRKYLRIEKLKRIALEKIEHLRIKTPGVSSLCLNLSGGNQQKVVIAKWLATDAKIFIIDEPTRGIDVGAKVEVYQLINRLLEKDCAVLMVSSELEEVIRVCDRVYVMQNGKLTGHFEDDSITEENIIRASIGGM